MVKIGMFDDLKCKKFCGKGHCKPNKETNGREFLATHIIEDRCPFGRSSHRSLWRRQAVANNRQKRKCEWIIKYKKILRLTVAQFFTSLWYELKKKKGMLGWLSW